MKHVMSVATVFAVFLSYTATAGRYWSGTADDSVWSDTANWAETSGGATGASVPDSTTGTTYYRDLHNGFVVFDAIATLGANVRVDTGSETPFVWRAAEAANGFTTSAELRICENGGKSPAHLKIESGTYEAKNLRVGYAENSQTSLVMDGGTLTLSAESSVGYASGCIAEMVINEGATVNAVQYFYVGQNGVGKMTMNGGAFTMANLDGGGFSLCRRNDGASGTLELNGGTLTIPNFRVEFNRSADYPNSTGRIVFNGGTVVPTKSTTSFLSDADNLTCEIAAGGLIVDTAGFDITIKHALIGEGGIVKRGTGKLALTGANTFAGGITVEEGSVIDTDGTEYKPGNEPASSTTTLDASEGGDLGTVQLHRNPLAKWLANADFTTYASQYGAVGAECLETPRYIKVTVGGESKTYMNLKTGETVADELGGQSYSFTTESTAPRTIRIDSPSRIVANVRDVGSWPLESSNGKKMNQGVIFRGGNLDAFIGADAAVRTASWLTTVGLKTEIDLRAASQDQPSALVGATESPAADDCAYVNCGLDWSGTQISADSDGNFTNQIRRVFSTLGSEGTLPAYFHCQIGTDRTGVVGLLLLGLMGVEEETLYRDYLMSNFANIGGSRTASVVDTFLRYIHRGDCNGGRYAFADNEYGLSVAARCRAYLEMCGVTAAELERITRALSGETPDEVLARVDAYETANGYRTVSYVPYEGESVVACHRFGASSARILPTDTPVRVGYTFLGWDVDNETDNGDGTATVYALWDAGETPDREALTFKWDNNG